MCQTVPKKLYKIAQSLPKPRRASVGNATDGKFPTAATELKGVLQVDFLGLYCLQSSSKVKHVRGKEMKTSFPVSARKAIMLLALMLIITVFTACDKNINGMFSGSSGNIAPSTREGIILTKEEADKMLATDLDIDGDGSIATNSYWFTSQMFPAANNSIKASVRASSSPNGKTILFFTRLNNQWINFTSDLRLALENEGYEVLVQNNDQPLQDLSDIDVLAIIDSLGTPFVSPNDRPLSLQDKTKILNFIAFGKGFFFSGDWVFSELSKYNDIAGMFDATLSPNVIDYIPVYENGYVSPYFLPYDWNAYVFDFINFYQTYPSQPIFKRAPLYGYSSFSNADHAIFKNVNQVLLLGSSHIRPKGLQIEAGVKTHPTTSSPRDYPITPEGYPLIVAKNYGAGRVVLSCDSNCFANDGFAKSDLAGTDNKVFAINVFNWLAYVSPLPESLEITSPVESSQFQLGETITFVGTGTTTNIHWSSNLDGDIGSSFPTIATSGLRIGTHTITLSGQTSGGQPLTDSITVGVQPLAFGITFNPEEVRPTGTTNAVPTAVTVTVTSAGRPVANHALTATTTAVLHSGGHHHNCNRPVGAFVASAGITDENGMFTTNYTPSAFGGSETIRINSVGYPNASGSRDITVRAPDLVLLPDSNDYDQIGGTVHHPGPPIGGQPNTNHWGLQGLIDAIESLAEAYNDEYEPGPLLAFNDMSLPNGGLFDINGDWTRPHRTHREGVNVDLRINNLDVQTRTWLRPQIRLIFGRNPLDEVHHWHLTNDN